MWELKIAIFSIECFNLLQLYYTHTYTFLCHAAGHKPNPWSHWWLYAKARNRLHLHAILEYLSLTCRAAVQGAACSPWTAWHSVPCSWTFGQTAKPGIKTLILWLIDYLNPNLRRMNFNEIILWWRSQKTNAINCFISDIIFVLATTKKWFLQLAVLHTCNSEFKSAN